MSYLSDSPSLIVRTFLVAQSLFTLPSSRGGWPLYASHLPDGNDVKDNAGAILDGTPDLDKRVHVGSHNIHYGLQILIRSVDYEAGWLKCKTLLSLFEVTTKTTVVVDNGTYTIWTIVPNGVIGFNGTEPGTKRRYLFTNGYKLTISED